MSVLTWVFVCVFRVCVCVSVYAFMSVVSVNVCECVRAYVRACVNFVSNVTQIYSKLIAAKIYCIIVTNALLI